jgi:hypothetical protein
MAPQHHGVTRPLLLANSFNHRQNHFQYCVRLNSCAHATHIPSECVLTPMCAQEVPGPSLPIIKVADFGLSKHDASLTFTRVVSNWNHMYCCPTAAAAWCPSQTAASLADSFIVRLPCQQALRRLKQTASGSTATVPSRDCAAVPAEHNHSELFLCCLCVGVPFRALLST